MTIQMSELELIEEIPTMSDDDIEHLVCPFCYPVQLSHDELPYIAVCGAADYDEEIIEAPGRYAITCDPCRGAEKCPKCYRKLWWP